jgi:hypothetical protein
MTTRKVAFWFWGFVYWPFLVVGIVFGGIGTGIFTVGEWLHDLMYDLAFPVHRSSEGGKTK